MYRLVLAGTCELGTLVGTLNIWAPTDFSLYFAVIELKFSQHVVAL